jgi:hypothetical protein
MTTPQYQAIQTEYISVSGRKTQRKHRCLKPNYVEEGCPACEEDVLEDIRLGLFVGRQVNVSGWRSSKRHICQTFSTHALMCGSIVEDFGYRCPACQEEYMHDKELGFFSQEISVIPKAYVPGKVLLDLNEKPQHPEIIIDSVLTNDKPDFREDGERSKHMPADMSDRYERSLQDTELLNLRRDLAMMEARIHDLMDTVNQGESTGAWNELRLCGERFTTLWGRREMERAQEQLMTMLEIIEHGSTRANGWDELQRTIELRRRLSETETKRLQALKQFVTAERAVTLVEDVIEVIRRHVHDPEARRNCVRDLKRLIVTTDNRGD